MDLQPLDVLVYRGLYYDPMTWVIAVRTSTLWSHVATVIDQETIVEATIGGVMKSPLSKYAGRETAIMRLIQPLSAEQITKGLSWLDDVIKTAEGYDYLALLGFLTGVKNFNDSQRFYCAEIPVNMFLAMGIKMYSQTPAFIYPCAYLQSNLFEEVSA